MMFLFELLQKLFRYPIAVFASCVLAISNKYNKGVLPQAKAGKDGAVIVVLGQS